MKIHQYWFQILAVATAAAVIVLVIQGRHAQAQRNEGLRTFICFFQSAVLHPQHGPQPTAEQKKVIFRFFDGVMTKLHEPSCPQ